MTKPNRAIAEHVRVRGAKSSDRDQLHWFLTESWLRFFGSKSSD